MPEQFHSLVPIFPNQPISSFICTARHFVFLTTVCDVRILNQLHGTKLKCDAAPIIQTKVLQKFREKAARGMQIYAN